MIFRADEIAGSSHAYAKTVPRRLDHAAGGAQPDFRAFVRRNGLRRFFARRLRQQAFSAQAQTRQRTLGTLRRLRFDDEFTGEFPQSLDMFA